MKIIKILLVVVLVLLANPIHSVAAQKNNPIIITKQFEVSAVKNNNTDESKDYTVTVKGTIKNTSTETISNIKIYLDVSTAFLRLEDTLLITLNRELLPNQTYNINLTQDLAEKFAKVDKVYATVDGGESFDLLPSTTSSSSNSSNEINIDYEAPDIWVSVTLLAVFSGLFVVAILINRPKNKI